MAHPNGPGLRVVVTRSLGLGGGQVWAHEFSNRLALLGHHVQVIFLRKWWPGGMRSRCGADTVNIDGARYRATFLDVPLFFEGCWLKAFLGRNLRQHTVDVIVSTGSEAAWLDFVHHCGAPPRVASFHHPLARWVGARELIAAAGNLTRCGIARTYHCWDEFLDRLSLSRANQVVCSSTDQSERVVNELKIPTTKVKIIHYGIDTDRLKPHNGKHENRNLNILYAGGLSPSKGLHILLDAFGLISRRFPKAIISVVGAGDWAPYQEKIKALGLSECVCYCGYVSHEAMVNYYRSACLLAAPTRHESFGLILAEAMACGIPVVSTRITAIPEVVEDGVTGLLVPVDDPPALADALEALLSDPDRAATMGRAGRTRVEEYFSWGRVMREWERVLFQVAEGSVA